MTKEIPKSTWVLNKVYFPVKVVDDFKEGYFKWLREYDVIPTDEEELNKLNEFIHYIIKRSYRDCLELYEFPTKGCYDFSGEYDYFEKDDCNYVIPRHLFELI